MSQRRHAASYMYVLLLGVVSLRAAARGPSGVEIDEVSIVEQLHRKRCHGSGPTSDYLGPVDHHTFGGGSGDMQAAKLLTLTCNRSFRVRARGPL